jgi:hypothetical protein
VKRQCPALLLCVILVALLDCLPHLCCSPSSVLRHA